MDFFDLHKREECIFLGNVWDTLSAIIMQNSNFKALGTTNWGVANTLSYNDGERIFFSDS